MEPIKIEVELDLTRHLAGEPIQDHDGEYVGAHPTTLEDIVLGLAAKAIVEQIAGASTMGLPQEERDQVRARRKEIRDGLLEAAAAHAAEATDEMIRAEFDALIARPDEDGRSVIEETIRQTVGRRIEEALKLRPRNERDRAYREHRSVLDALVVEHVDRSLSGEIKAAVDKGKQEVLGEVRKQAAAAYASALGKIQS